MRKVNQKAYLLAALILSLIVIAMMALGSAFTALMIAFFLAYLTYPMISLLERKGIGRHMSMMLTAMVSATALTLVLIIILPILYHEAQFFFLNLPEYIVRAIDVFNSQFTKLGIGYQIDKDIGLALKKIVGHMSLDKVGMAYDVVLAGFGNVLATLVGLMNLFLIPVFYYYIVDKYEHITEGAYRLVPKQHHHYINKYIQQINQILRGYFRGQFLLLILLGIFYGTLLSILGLRFGLIIGLITGLLSVLPYVGFTIGLFLAVVSVMANFEWMTLLGVFAVYAIGQVLEGMVLAPKLVGDRVGLNDLETMLALIILGNLFGFWGIVLAIPLAAMIKVGLHDLCSSYQKLIQ